MSPLKPGEWGINEVEHDPYDKGSEIKENSHALYSSESLVSIYQSLSQVLKCNPSVVYYPCCSTDVTPSKAFPDSRVIYLDLDEQAIKVLQEHSYEAHAISALEFQIPEEVDVLILLNPGIKPDTIVQQVKNSGHVICNNYHDTAFEIAKMAEFEPVATVLHIGREKRLIDVKNAKDYLTYVKDDAEFEQADPTTFAIAKNVRGDAQSVLEGYVDFLKDGTLFWGRIFKSNGEGYAPLPTKRTANVDDFFVFRKIQKNATDTNS